MVKKSLIRIARSKGRLSRKLYKLSKLFIRAYENYDYNFQTNGELHILKKLGEFKPRMVFDVGAHYGEWSLAAHSALPDAEIHAFEIVPQTFKRLSEAVEGKGRIISGEFGLFNEEKDCQVNYFSTKDTHSSIIETPYLEHAPQKNKFMGKLKKGDNYCLENSIGQIDFLKIDVEGSEPYVLQGFEQMLARKKIDVVQFEYTLNNISTKYLLKDFHQFFESKGYLLGKLFPDGVFFKPYAYEDENFHGPNFIAVSTDREDIRRSLSA